MSSTPEGKVKDQVKKLLKEFGCYQHWPVQSGFGAPALDCHGCHQGLYFAVETKAPGKKPTPRQELTAADIRAAGGRVFIVGEHFTDDYPEGLRGLYAKQAAKYTGLAELHAWLSSHSPAA
ncbi:MAG: hypothetical protein ACRCV5_09330 [Afipia sp.]